jgi:hypothetical protein
LFFVSKKLLKLVEAFGPELLVLMHPNRYLAEWFRPKGDDDLSSLFSAFNQPSSLEQFEMLGHRVQSGVERLGDVQETSGTIRQIPDNRPAGRVRKGVQYIGQLIHANITP